MPLVRQLPTWIIAALGAAIALRSGPAAPPVQQTPAALATPVAPPTSVAPPTPAAPLAPAAPATPVAVPAAAAAWHFDDAHATDLAEIAARARASGAIPGLVVAVVTTSGVQACGADGIRTKGDAAPLLPTDRMHLGSCTKAFTATLCATFVAEGALRWSSTVGAVLGASVPQMDPDWREVTLEELLRHRGGAPGAADPADWRAAFTCDDPPEACRKRFVEALLGRAPAQARGTLVYSNQGYAIAGRMCEVAGNAPYETLLTQRLLAPLGITHAGFGPPSRADPAAPKGHAADGRALDGDNPSAITPAGTLHMPLADWGRFVAFHLGSPPPPALAGAAKELAALHRDTDPAKREALGWFVMDRPWGGRVLTHSGSNTQWFCVAWLAPERGFAVLAATNQGGDQAQRACDTACAEAIKWRTEQRAHPVPAAPRITIP